MLVNFEWEGIYEQNGSTKCHQVTKDIILMETEWH
jgi:hypothetical protein